MTTYFQELFAGAAADMTGLLPAVNLNPNVTAGWQRVSVSYWLVRDGNGMAVRNGPLFTDSDPVISRVGTNNTNWAAASPPTNLPSPAQATFTLKTQDIPSVGSTSGLMGIKLHIDGQLMEAGLSKEYGRYWLRITGAPGQDVTDTLVGSTVYTFVANFASGASSITITELGVTQNSTTTFPGTVGLSAVYACIDKKFALGPITIISTPVDTTVRAKCTAPALLGAPGLLGTFVPYAPPAAKISAPALLGAPRLALQHDFTALLGDATSVYVADLITPGGPVRVPVSSWQATLRADAASYVQCVVPACTAWEAAINSATEVVINRRALLPSGAAVEAEMARAPLDTAQFDQGPQRHTCTLSGYGGGFAASADPSAGYDRTLTGVRSISSGNQMRVRCAVDWLLRPGQRAWVQGVPLVVDYINYYCPSEFDAYMDVGGAA